MTIFTGAPRTPRDGQYVIDGKKYPRVTTICGVIAKPDLYQWRANVGAVEADRRVREAAAFGTAVHEACEAWDKGQIPDGAGDAAFCEIEPFVLAWDRWKTRNVKQLLGIEQRVHHAKHVYAGTYDRLVRLDDRSVALIDFKTSGRPDGTWPIQLAAYAQAIEHMGIATVDRRLVLHMPRDEGGRLYVIAYDDHDRDDRMWRAVLRAWRYWQRRKYDYRTVRGEEFTG